MEKEEAKAENKTKRDPFKNLLNLLQVFKDNPYVHELASKPPLFNPKQVKPNRHHDNTFFEWKKVRFHLIST